MRNSAALSALQHLVLRVQLLLPLVLPIVAVRTDDRRGPTAVRLILQDRLNLKLDLPSKLNVSFPIDFIDLTVKDPVAVFVVSTHALQQLEELTLGFAGGKNNEANA